MKQGELAQLIERPDVIGKVTDGNEIRGISSVGRALAWHARGQRFEPAILHSFKRLTAMWVFLLIAPRVLIPTLI
jgi:hypothetical protein